MAASPYKGTPEYASGFDDEMQSMAMIEQESPAYQAGVQAAKNVRALMRHHGFSDEGGGSFTVSLPLIDEGEGTPLSEHSER
jgi:hypothetical protein